MITGSIFKSNVQNVRLVLSRISAQEDADQENFKIRGPRQFQDPWTGRGPRKIFGVPWIPDYTNQQITPGTFLAHGKLVFHRF